MTKILEQSEDNLNRLLKLPGMIYAAEVNLVKAQKAVDILAKAEGNLAVLTRSDEARKRDCIRLRVESLKREYQAVSLWVEYMAELLKSTRHERTQAENTEAAGKTSDR